VLDVVPGAVVLALGAAAALFGVGDPLEGRSCRRRTGASRRHGGPDDDIDT